MFESHSLLEAYPKSVFRFRPYSPLSLKELRYGELFFSSCDELNDPYDVKNPTLFEGDFNLYYKVVDYVVKSVFRPISSSEHFVTCVAKFLSRKDLQYDELIHLLDSEEFLLLIEKESVDIIGLHHLTGFLVRELKRFFHGCTSGNGYIVSFSKVCSEPLMWSHYADQHKGFCLVFDPSNKTIEERPMLRNSTLHGQYAFQEVSYKTKNVTTNGFYGLSVNLFGRDLTDNERKQHWATRRQAFLTKHTNWKYEEEVRLIHDDWLPRKVDEHGSQKLFAPERIFYYNQNQLIGVIFGSRMSEENKTNIELTIRQLRRELINDSKPPPTFMFYESVENPDKFEMTIKPIKGLDFNNKSFPLEDFEKVKLARFHWEEFLKRKAKK